LIDSDSILCEQILQTIQTFDPPGIGARNLQESLLIQLQIKGKQDSLSYCIVQKHFDDLIHNRIPTLQKHVNYPIQKLLPLLKEELGSLNFAPAKQFSHETIPYVAPDLFFKHEDDKWSIELYESSLPSFQLSSNYLSLLSDHPHSCLISAARR